MFWFLISIVLLYMFLIMTYMGKSKESKVLEKKVLDTLKIYIRQCMMLSYASTQDVNPIIKVLHANYGISYLMVIKDYLEMFDIPREYFKKIAAISLFDLEKRVIEIQDKATRELAKKTTDCLKIPDDILLKNIV